MQTVRGLHHVTAIAGPGAGEPGFLRGRARDAPGEEKREPGRSRHLPSFLRGRGRPSRHRPDLFSLGADGAEPRRLRTEQRSFAGRAARQPRFLERPTAAIRNHAGRRPRSRFGQAALAFARSPRTARGAGRERGFVRPAFHCHGTEVRFRWSTRFAVWKARAWSSAISFAPLRFLPGRWVSLTSAAKTAGIVIGVGDGKSGAYVDLYEMPTGRPRRLGHRKHSSSRLAGGR